MHFPLLKQSLRQDQYQPNLHNKPLKIKVTLIKYIINFIIDDELDSKFSHISTKQKILHNRKKPFQSKILIQVEFRNFVLSHNQAHNLSRSWNFSTKMF